LRQASSPSSFTPCGFEPVDCVEHLSLATLRSINSDTTDQYFVPLGEGRLRLGRAVSIPVVRSSGAVAEIG
jgi:hypothetical protein